MAGLWVPQAISATEPAKAAPPAAPIRNCRRLGCDGARSGVVPELLESRRLGGGRRDDRGNFDGPDDPAFGDALLAELAS